METKTCERCGREFSRPLSFSNQTWAKQKYCTLLCANRTRAERRRTRGSETKPCEQCGAEMTWPLNYSAKQWAAKRYCGRACSAAGERAATDLRRPPRPCAICGQPYRSRYENQRTCRKAACVAEYRRTVSGPARSERMRADYIAGRRKPSPGISPREVALWPLLREHGWLWRLRWIEAPDRTVEFDFALLHEKLAVEIDGPEHRYPRKSRSWRTDADRDAELAERGWRILRISNEDVDASPEAVAERISRWARDSRAECRIALSPTSF